MITVLFLAGALGLLLLAWRRAGSVRSLAWIMLAAFILRLGVSLVLSWALPAYGYPGNQAQQMGYYYIDGQRRDSAAIALARSDEPLLSVFKQEVVSDQYGGLLLLSAWIYRYLSPASWRPELISIVTATVAVLGIALAWVVLRRRFGEPTATTAAWILALYPEFVLLGGAPMREPYLIAGMAVLLWAGNAWQEAAASRRPEARMLAPRQARIWPAAAFVVTSAAMVLISSRVALPVIGIVLIGLLWDQAGGFSGAGGLSGWRKAAAWAGLGAVLLLGLAFSWSWLQESMVWDTQLTVKQSGWVQAVLERLPEAAAVPFVVGYGLVQPVLPAAISDLVQPLLYVPPAGEASLQAAPLLLRSINFLVSLSWYALLPVLVYGFFSAWRAETPSNRRFLVVCAVAALAWMVIASARAGGDQWDNPRYRSIALVWMAALAAWTWVRALSRRDPWLLRGYAVAGIFVLVFAEWYISRYTRLIGRLDFFQMIVLIAGLSGLVLAGGWIWDRVRRSRKDARARVTLTQPPEPL
jgi:hypothetical protein